MIESLRRIVDLEVDTVIPGLFIGDTAYVSITPGTFRRQIDDVIERLKRGERH